LASREPSQACRTECAAISAPCACGLYFAAKITAVDRIELEKLNTLMAHWERVTTNTLNNYLENRGELQFSENDNLGSIESNIKSMVHDDFSIDGFLTGSTMAAFLAGLFSLEQGTN
jgi:hypothetical protein